MLKNWQGNGLYSERFNFASTFHIIFILNTALSKRTRGRSFETYKQMLFRISGSTGQFQVVFLFFKALIKCKTYGTCV